MKSVYAQDRLASISCLGSQVGPVPEHVERSSLADETVVIYTSDHGLMGKRNATKPQRAVAVAAR